MLRRRKCWLIVPTCGLAVICLNMLTVYVRLGITVRSDLSYLWETIDSNTDADHSTCFISNASLEQNRTSINDITCRLKFRLLKAAIIRLNERIGANADTQSPRYTSAASGKKAKFSFRSQRCLQYNAEYVLNRTLYEERSIWGQINVAGKKSDITAVTQLSMDRLGVLTKLNQQYGGPVSSAIYITLQALRDVDRLLQKFKENRPLFEDKKLDIHLLVESGVMYPVNYLRNLALNESRTDHVFLTDVDFVPGPGAHDRFRARLTHRVVNTSQEALIVPAFETTLEKPYPRTKDDLLALVKDEKAILFHSDINHAKGHGLTNLSLWKRAEQPYKISFNIVGFEPYIIMRKELTPLYDTRFVGRGYNKAVHILHIFCLGFDFVVLPDVYTIHHPHPRIPLAFMGCSLKRNREVKEEYWRKCPERMAQLPSERRPRKWIHSHT